MTVMGILHEKIKAFCTKIAVFSPKTCIVKKIVLPLHRFYGDSLAQLVEHIPFKDGVVGSNPTRITTKTASTTACGLSFSPTPHPQSKTGSVEIGSVEN